MKPQKIIKCHCCSKDWDCNQYSYLSNYCNDCLNMIPDYIPLVQAKKFLSILKKPR